MPLKQAGYYNAAIGHFVVGVSRHENLATFRPPGVDRFVLSVGGSSATGGTVTDNGRSRAYSGGSSWAFMQFAKQAIAEAGSRPFALHIGLHDPHTPYTPPAPFATAAVPGAPRTPSFNVPGIDFPAYLTRPRMSSAQIATTDTIFRGSVRETLAADAAIGDLVGHLRSIGRLNNTYIFVITDNGYHFGHHAFVPFNPPKQMPFDNTVRTPFFVTGPGVRVGSEQRVTMNADLAPTILELAGVQIPAYMEGRSLVPLLRGQNPAGWRTAAPYLLRGAANAIGAHTPRWSYVVTSGGSEWLIDKQADPHQLRNVARSQPAVAQRMRAIANALNTCTGASCRTADRAAVP